jgi:molybdopterin synthase catalytic subunit
MREGIMLTDEPIDGGEMLASVASAAAGANVLFVGTTRSLTRPAGGGPSAVTERLEYEAHATLARAELVRLRAEAVSRFGLTGCRIVHRLGVVAVGEASVAVAVSAAHRREAFEAAEWVMEEVKRRVPIWKCEVAPDGGRFWVHPVATPRESGS